MEISRDQIEMFEALVEKAKRRVILEYEGKEETGRAWLEASLDSYEMPSYRLRILVLEGSPAKGYIIINYGTGTVRGYTCHDTRLFTWNFYEQLSVHMESYE